ncbi:MAG: SDR family oxidoreductase [Bacteroidaceae bacterium]|nr:SDR family oxidoreductase [Bacteroidaceae bacterium]
MLFNKLKTAIKAILRFIQPRTIIQANIAQLSPNKMLSGRCALITGGTSGIGLAIAEAYLKAGARVVITGRSKSKLKNAVEELSAYGICNGVVMDITKTEELSNVFAEIVCSYGQIDILVNNAGVSGALISNATPNAFDIVLDTNLKGVFFLSQIVGKYMVKQGIKGNILNISSASSIRPAACAYTISKWGVRGFTQGLARTLLPYGITVNALAPGPTATPLLNRGGDDNDIALSRTPAGRFALPCEIASMAVILVSDIARLVVGDTVFMTGGAGNINNCDIDYPF